MKRVKFIKSLNVEILPLTDYNIRYWNTEATPIMDEGEEKLLHTTLKVKMEIIPVHILSKVKGRKRISTTYIAYSKEVEDLLDMPFNTMRREIKELSFSLQFLHNKIDTATIFNKLRYLFTGKLK